MPNDAAPDTSAPRPLVVARLVTLAQAGIFVALTVAQLAAYSADRAAMNVTTVLGFALWALMLGFCGWRLLHASWARSPIVMAQLINLGVAWSFVRDSGTVDASPEPWHSVVAWIVAAASVVVLVGIFHPRSIRHLAAVDTD